MSDPRLDHHFDRLRLEASALVRPPGLDGARRTARRRRAALIGSAAVLVVAAIGVPVALAGQDDDGFVRPADPPAEITHAPTPTAPTSPTATGPTTPATAGATHVGTTTCTNLALSYVRSEGAAGTNYTIYRLRNSGAVTCDLKGYPGVSYLDAAGKEVQRDARRESAAPAKVTLRPVGEVHFEVGNSLVVPNVACPGNRAAVTLRVYPPDNTRALLLPGAYDVCDPHVRPVHAP
jgi:hypothetical protein